MKLNEDCLRDTLILLVDNLQIFIDKKYKTVEFGKLSVLQIAEELPEYSLEDVFQSLYILSQNNYVKGINNVYVNGQPLSNIYINEVTYLGFQLYESIQPEPLWNKTKNIIKQVGVHSLEFIETVAHDIAVESAKQMVALIIPNQKNE